MGTEVRLIVGPPARPGVPSAPEAAASARAWLEEFDRRLSRFRPGSELSALNADPREEVPVSRLLRAALGAGLWAARVTDGLVDPTLVGELEAAGYDASLDGAPRASLREALFAAPPRRGARPNGRWRRFELRPHAVRRPAGLRFDTGGTGKGLAADAVANLLDGHAGYLVDCGGDIRVRGRFSVAVEDPFSRRRPYAIRLSDGAVATSGLDRRIWRRGSGFAHHLLDPSTGEPAWTGLAAATALAPTALEAETLAKAALLSGPAGARRVLARLGGRIVHDDGRPELVGPLSVTYRLKEAA
jgi:thiamine biosynthesis lipoprotein